MIIMEMGSSMIKTKGLPNEYWGDDVARTIYLTNRSPTKVVYGKISQEAWSRKKWIAEHLRLFGCVAYALVPKQKRRKLDDEGEKCIFMCYSV